MVPESKDCSQQATVLHHFEFSSSLPSGSNCLRWSRCNRLIGLNLAQKLIIFQVNINYAINGSVVNRRQLMEENLKLCSITIEPKENVFTFNVGNLASERKSLRDNFIAQPKKTVPRFFYFDFSPSTPLRNYNLIGAITDDYCFVIYLQLGSQKWSLLHDLSTDLNRYFIENRWSNLEEGIPFDTYIQRLQSVWTTCFCWNSQCTYKDKSAEYRIYSATKSGLVCFWRITILQDNDTNCPKCETAIEQIIDTDLTDIVTIKFFDGILLVESADGRIVLYDLRTKNQNNKKLDLWTDRDNLPCSNFGFSHLAKNVIEIVFHKVECVLSARITAGFALEELRRQSVEDDIELLSVYSYDEKGKYCATAFNSTKIWTFSLPRGKLNLEEVKINFDFGGTSANMALFDLDLSSNQCLMALVASNNTFCVKSHAVKNVDLLFCSSSNANSVSDFLQRQLIAVKSTKAQILNFVDYLYIFRYYLYYEPMCESFQLLLHKLLEKYSKIDKTNWSTEEDLWRLKTVHFMLRRYWELAFLPANLTGQQENIQANLTEVLERARQSVLDWTIVQSLRMLTGSGGGKGVAPNLNYEQMVSLSNIAHNRQSVINNASQLPKGTLDHVERLVHGKEKPSLVASHSSIRGVNFKLAKSKTLLDALNKCPYCDQVVAQPVGEQCSADGHQLDLCANSRLIIDPLAFGEDLCASCFEARLLAPRIWPSPTMCPFDYSYDWCFFCL